MSNDSWVRVCFEAWYIDHFKEGTGLDLLPEELESMREGDGYGERPYLNGLWIGFQAGYKEGQYN